MKILVTLFFSLLICTQSLAFLRTYHKPEPELLGTLPVFYRSVDKAYAKAFIESIDWSYQENVSFEQLSDAAVYMIHLGRYDEAYDLLLQLYMNHSNEYIIVSNLATLYELTDRISAAHSMLEEAIALNPNPKNSYDWVYLAVLNAKKNTRNAPDIVVYNSVLNLDLHNQTQLNYQELTSMKDTIRQISQFMRSYLPFTSSPDLIVSNIMYELGLILEKHLSINDAFIAFKISEYYDNGSFKSRAAHISEINQKFNHYEHKHWDFKRPVLRDYFPPKNIPQNSIDYIKTTSEEAMIRRKAQELSINKQKRKQTSYFTMRVFTLFFGFIMLIFFFKGIK